MERNNYGGALQQPVQSGFGAASTASEVISGIDLKGKTAIVTGGYAGIGLEAVKAFTAAGAQVIVPARDIAKATRNIAGMENVVIETMDLMDPASIAAFAARFNESGRALHLLINNAGIMWVPLQRDSRGYESQFSTNHLGHFQLTALLWPALKKANGARVVNVSSWGHHFSPIVFDDPNFEQREYQPLLGYGQSKTANVLFSLELDNRGRQHGVRAYSLHPGGIVETDLGRHIAREDLVKMGVLDEQGNVIRDAANGLKTIPQGASTTVWCATSPMLNGIGGVYCENTDVAEMDTRNDDPFQRIHGVTRLGGVLPYAVDQEAAAKLWTLSENLTGLSFSI